MKKIRPQEKRRRPDVAAAQRKPRRPAPDQGIREDERGQIQPADKKRAVENR